MMNARFFICTKSVGFVMNIRGNLNSESLLFSSQLPTAAHRILEPWMIYVHRKYVSIFSNQVMKTKSTGVSGFYQMSLFIVDSQITL